VKGNKVLWITLGIIALLVIIVISGYNGLVRLSYQADNNWAQVENNLQRRYDLIPNLVETVKGYTAHEKGILDNLANARSRYAGAGTVEEKAAAEGELNTALGRLLVIVENYPNLKADTQFTRLQDEMAGTENRLAVARKDYNDSVTSYNMKIRSFPTNLYAGMFGFQSKEFFKIQDEARNNVKVNF
jgi:LemA protein